MNASPNSSPLGTQLQRIADLGFRLIEAVLVLIFTGLIVLVFSNVVMRYLFDTGLVVTDEVSRMMFVWICFLGAIVVARRNEHLDVDLLTAHMSPATAHVARMIALLGVIVCCVVLGVGAWQQTMFNTSNIAPASGLPTAVTYAAPFVGAVGIGLVSLTELISLLIRGPRLPAENTVEHITEKGKAE
ncbi:TRAP transporter small permease [Paracoccus denitrificans]|uniref:TRAP transporter small permease n=1 Tax=Paracoccus denitrificans TaxID=266 RepID=UPI0033650321